MELLKRSDGSLCKPSPPCRFKALIRLGSRLAVMHANDDSLGSDVEGRPFEVRQSARPTFFIWPRYNPVLKENCLALQAGYTTRVAAIGAR